jgi:tRNA(fMet)-specific endonuclease VapC
MLQFLFDTDHLTLYDYGHPRVRHRQVGQPSGVVGISPVTIQEYLRGRLAALTRHRSGALHVRAYANLVASIELFQHFPVAPFDAACDSEFQNLRALRLRIGSQDLRIAAIALVHNLTLLTRNRRDFAQIPGVKFDDWSV